MPKQLTGDGAKAIAFGQPETFRLPRYREVDPYFGLTRSTYYFGEAQGWWKLIRLIAPGNDRGITLVSYAAVAAYMRDHGQVAPQSSEAAKAARTAGRWPSKHKAKATVGGLKR